MTRIIALYLPQFHEIPENNEWWGNGHTEWTSCKRAVPLFRNHYQPRIPLDSKYYNLTDPKVLEWQSRIAIENGIDAFCYYHYWFNGKLLLEKPTELMLKNPNIKMPFCFSWANHSWTNALRKKERNILIKQKYGDKTDWINHFNYLLPFFKDERYIKVSEKPIIIIYDAANIPCWDEMKDVWENLAKENGLKGLYYISTLKLKQDKLFAIEHKFDAQFEYQPRYSIGMGRNSLYTIQYNIRRLINRDIIKRVFKAKYKNVWKKIIKEKHTGDIKTFLGAYVDWDTSARWGKQGEVHMGANPETFMKYLSIQMEKSVKACNEFLFVTAWNEWSEGAYLEPDERWEYGYLNAIKNVKRIFNNGNNS